MTGMTPMRLRLVEVPGDLGAAQIQARIAEVLPGTSFDASARGVFRRGGYEIEFLVVDNPTAIDVSITGVPGLGAIQQLVSKTGWRLVDADRDAMVDIAASRLTGALMYEPVKVAAPENHSPDPPAWRRVVSLVSKAAGVVVVLGISWMWTQRTPPEPRRFDPRAAEQRFLKTADAMRRRIERNKDIAAEFQGDVILHQLLDFRDASRLFDTTIGQGLYATPQRLSDPSGFGGVVSPYLPPSFANPERDGYEFAFKGDDCTRTSRVLSVVTGLCAGGAYYARPAGGAKGLSFVLFLHDDRIHFRRDGMYPNTSDPSVHNIVATTAADLEAPLGSPGVVNGVIAVMLGWLSGTTVANASLAFHEGEALKDLRSVHAAESHFAALAFAYVEPAQLADADLFRDSSVRVLLPARFQQSTRGGYRYEFHGADRMLARDHYGFKTSRFSWFYQSYVYIARPIDPGPEGRQSFALYPEGIYATSEDRAATRKDTPIGLRR